MARPREFDPQEALNHALQIFWRKGYASTSLRDLTRAMGLSKSRLYDTYGDKRQLLLATLKRYNDLVIEPMAVELESDRPGRAEIERIFQDLIAGTQSDEARRGCFLTNCAAELAPHDSDASQAVRDGFARLESAFDQAIQRAQVEGDIPAGKDSRKLARFLVSSLNGMRIVAKANTDRKLLQDVADAVLSTLG
ncbi:MAG: TetR/AcrR family transcriptional regulator [Acidobacteriota bacterium]